MKQITKVLFGAALVGALAIAVPLPATAATLYENINYGGTSWTGTTTGSLGVPVGINDKASSVTNSGTETYCENSNCSGRRLTWTGNANNLHSITTGLHGWENWGDRISGLI